MTRHGPLFLFIRHTRALEFQASVPAGKEAHSQPGFNELPRLARVLLHRNNTGAVERLAAWINEHEGLKNVHRFGGLHGQCRKEHGRRSNPTVKPPVRGEGGHADNPIVLD